MKTETRPGTWACSVKFSASHAQAVNMLKPTFGIRVNTRRAPDNEPKHDPHGRFFVPYKDESTELKWSAVRLAYPCFFSDEEGSCRDKFNAMLDENIRKLKECIDLVESYRVP